MAVQERNSEMVNLLAADFIRKNDTSYVAAIYASAILILPGLVSFWPMGVDLNDENDSYADYAYLPGRTGGQTLNGGISASETLTLRSTAHATKGKILFGNSAYDEVNNFLGVGTATPDGLQVSSTVAETARGVDNVRMGITSGTPRIILEESAGNTQWEMDNDSGLFRLFQPGTVFLTVDNNSVFFLKNVGGVPGSNPVGGGYLFVDAGALKYRGSSGTISTIAPA